MIGRLILSGLLMATALVPGALADRDCTSTPDYRACVTAIDESWMTRYAAEVEGDDGTWVEASVTRGDGFFGPFLVGIAWVHVPGVGGAYGGFGASDFAPGWGTYEDACVCGAVYADGVGWYPYGVGARDSDGDGYPDAGGAWAEVFFTALP